MMTGRIKLLFALGLAMLFDPVSGAAVYHVASRLGYRDVHLLGYMFAMFLASIPDLDVVVERLRKGRVTGQHKTSFTHVPLVVMPLAFAAIFPFSRFWAWVAILCLTMHYLHDLFETGPGVPLFAPFADQRYLLCKKRGEKYLAVYPITPEELHVRVTMTAEEWLRRRYLHPTIDSVLGPVVLAATLIMMLLW